MTFAHQNQAISRKVQAHLVAPASRRRVCMVVKNYKTAGETPAPRK